MAILLDPQQEVFITMRKAIEELDLDCGLYDTTLPPEGTAYPFVYMGFTQQIDTRTKTQIIGTIYQDVDIWHDNPKQRGTVSAMALQIKSACLGLTATNHFSVDVSLNDQQILADKSTDITLLRCMLSFKIKFS